MFGDFFRFSFEISLTVVIDELWTDMCQKRRKCNAYAGGRCILKKSLETFWKFNKHHHRNLKNMSPKWDAYDNFWCKNGYKWLRYENSGEVPKADRSRCVVHGISPESMAGGRRKSIQTAADEHSWSGIREVLVPRRVIVVVATARFSSGTYRISCRCIGVVDPWWYCRERELKRLLILVRLFCSTYSEHIRAIK